ncbi:MAG TPA: helix-turn-helix domain-containing protein [Polyangiaceae bacterium]|nr:helix-turn-helix domain-containing protein [Polyangiaceae bacterium]
MTLPAGMREPQQPRAHKTRAALVEAARLEFSDRGYALTTAKSIAERAALGTGTFYHYFPDKDALLREITRERVHSMHEQTAPLAHAPPAVPELRVLIDGARTRMRALVELFVAYHRADRALHTVITERRLCDAEIEAIMAASEREAVERLANVLRGWGYEGDSEAAAYMMFCLLEGAVHGHVLGQALVSDERFTEGLVLALLRIAMPARLVQLPDAWPT